MAKKIRSAQEEKALNNKVAEIIWLSLAGLILLLGLLAGIIHLITHNITGNQANSPFYFLIQFETGFITWVKSWWADFGLTHLGAVSFVLLIIGLAFLLLVLLIFSNRVDSVEKKDKAKLQREQNRKRFEESLKLGEPTSILEEPVEEASQETEEKPEE